MTACRISLGRALLVTDCEDQDNMAWFQGKRINVNVVEGSNKRELLINEAVLLKTLFLVTSRTTKGASRYLLRNRTKGSTIFVTSSREKLLWRLVVSNNDVLVKPVQNESLPPSQVETKSTKKVSKKAKKKGRQTSKKAAPTTVEYNSQDDHMIQHSKLLSFVFEEAEEVFKHRRQRLNTLVLQKCVPKERTSIPKAVEDDTGFADAFVNSSVDRKAGKSIYPVIVGQTDNLYWSSKKSSLQCTCKHFSIDLHGCSKNEATEKEQNNRIFTLR